MVFVVATNVVDPSAAISITEEVGYNPERLGQLGFSGARVPFERLEFENTVVAKVV
jgi:hypothetical protein